MATLVSPTPRQHTHSTHHSALTLQPIESSYLTMCRGIRRWSEWSSLSIRAVRGGMHWVWGTSALGWEHLRLRRQTCGG